MPVNLQAQEFLDIAEKAENITRLVHSSKALSMLLAVSEGDIIENT